MPVTVKLKFGFFLSIYASVLKRSSKMRDPISDRNIFDEFIFATPGGRLIRILGSGSPGGCHLVTRLKNDVQVLLRTCVMYAYFEESIKKS